MRRIHRYRDFLIERYGKPVHRIPIDLELGCPHRREDGSGGCTFCPKDGSRATQTTGAVGPQAQVEQAMEFARRRYKAEHFMAYFQAFTATFAPASVQRSLYEPILNEFDFVAVAIGTRPDCLSPGTLEHLDELKAKRDVWVELGVQTTHDKSLQAINRGHDWACSEAGILKLAERGIHPLIHLIIGIPGETPEDWLTTVKRVTALPIAGIKFHHLHVIADTDLANEYAQSPFPTLSEWDYLEALLPLIRHVPMDIPLMRLQTDTPSDELIAPIWDWQKNRFIDEVERHLGLRGWFQGDLVDSDPLQTDEEIEVPTEDGKWTLVDNETGAHHHPPAGPEISAQWWLQAAPLPPSEAEDPLPLRVLDIGTGAGANLLAFNRACEDLGRPLHALGLDIKATAMAQAAKTHPLLAELHRQQSVPWCGSTLQVVWGDARHTVTQVRGAFDRILLDAFTPHRNPELWTQEFLKMLLSLCADDGVLILPNRSPPVLAALADLGAAIAQPPGSPMTVAALSTTGLMLNGLEAMTPKDESTRAIVYRDPLLKWSRSQILSDREQRIAKAKET